MKEPRDPREEANWRSAVDELRRRNYIEGRDHTGQLFEVTKSGFEEADACRRERFCGGIEIMNQLDSGQIGYLLALSRPRNQSGISFSFFDDFPTRESETYRSMLEQLQELQLVRTGGGPSC